MIPHLNRVFSLRSATVLAFGLTLSIVAQAQQDTTQHGWPVTPFFSTHPITGVFGEFRNTGSSDHFHNGTDIPKPDGSPVYSVYNGTVTSLSASGTDAYVRVRYNVSGLIKSDAYVHINPNPLLIVGDSVFAFQTVLGNILSGQGHVHFTNGQVGAEMNGIRPVGGFTPYIDIYPPSIEWVKFFVDETNIELPNNRVSGLVDIRTHIRETNASNQGDVTGSTSNNGTYIAGYRILSADGSSVVYEPPSAGVRFRFDSKPSNSYVARVFASGSDLSTHIYTITNGDGATFVNQSGVVNNNYWNTLALPVGNYIVMVFAEDTRGLKDTAYIPVEVKRPDVVPPVPPLLQSVINDTTGKFTVRWESNPDADLMGYRLYFSLDGTNWTQKESETTLGKSATSIAYAVSSSTPIYFRMAAVDSASPPNISTFSDVYGVRLNLTPTKALIVDGFDRADSSGSYHDDSHPFAMSHGRSMSVDFSTCSNEAVINGLVSLNNFDFVVWILGDESTDGRTFDSTEQALLKSYLQNGGKLFVSGSEIAWDLDRPSGPSEADRDFLHTFLKARYLGDNSAEYTVTGLSGTLFSDVNLRFGVVSEGAAYEEDSPDYILPEDGSTVLLQYGTQGSPLYAGVGFKGLFPNGNAPGAVAYFSFPFETITTKANRDTLMKRVLQYFDVLTSVEQEFPANLVPEAFSLKQNYPNPFNPSTEIAYSVPVEIFVTIGVYNTVGQLVDLLVNERKTPGTHRILYEPGNLSSGVYFYRMTTSSFSATRKLVIVK